MQKFDVIEQFEIISEEIISLTQEISEIIKKNDFDETSDILTIEDRYLKREQSIEELNKLISTSEGVKIPTTDRWTRFMEKIVPVEEENINFFETKLLEIKDKLLEITKTKKLLLYNDQ